MAQFRKALLSNSRVLLVCFYFSIRLSQSYSLSHLPGFVCFLFLLHSTVQSVAYLFVSHNWNVSFMGSGSFCVLYFVIPPTLAQSLEQVEAKEVFRRKTLPATVSCSVYSCRNCGRLSLLLEPFCHFSQVPDLLPVSQFYLWKCILLWHDPLYLVWYISKVSPNLFSGALDPYFRTNHSVIKWVSETLLFPSSTWKFTLYISVLKTLKSLIIDVLLTLIS